MPSKSGRTGQSIHDHTLRRALVRAAFGLTAVVALWFFFKVLPHAQALGIAMLALLYIGFKVAIWFLDTKMDPMPAEDLPAGPQAVDEEKIEEILDELGHDQLVLHDVGCQFGKIDYIVLSRSHGVFLIETKTDGGRVAMVDSKIRVDGKLPEQDFIGETLHNTYWLIEELETITGVRPSVVSLIVFTNAFVAKNRPIKGITVTDQQSLLENMRQLGTPLEPQVWGAREKIADLFQGSPGTIGG